MTKRKEKDLLKSRLNQLDDDITSAQLKVEVEKRDEKIARLREENDSLKEDLAEVKDRNRKLCQILSQGESKYRYTIMTRKILFSFVFAYNKKQFCYKQKVAGRPKKSKKRSQKNSHYFLINTFFSTPQIIEH